jgi:cell division septation protein DedD
MDVGYYISELLGRHGDVNVPGLGYFAHTRVNGYYNDREGKFYPPGYSVQFDPQFLDDDDVLAVHIAEKKKISVASSKYFTEKFVLGLKQQAAVGETMLADLGSFTMYNLQLIFRPNNVTSTDPEFFGYPTISLKKIGKAAAVPQYQPEAQTYTPEPAIPQYQPEPQFTPQEYYVAPEQEEYLVELVQKKRRRNTWIFITLTALATAAAILMVKKYDPEAFKFSFLTPDKEKQAEQPKIVMETVDTGKTKPAADSLQLVRKMSPDSAADTMTTTPLHAQDIASIPRFEVIAGKFKTIAEAGKAIIAFKAKNIEAKIVPDAPGTGTLIKVSVGTFITRGEAEDAKKGFIDAKQIKEADLDILQINPVEPAKPRVKK